MEARGVPAHPGRGRGRGPGRVQRPHPHATSRIPRRQAARGVRRGRIIDTTGHVRLSRIGGVDPRRGERLHDRTRRHRQVPHPHRVGSQRSKQDIRSATSPPPNWSRPSIGDWPTTHRHLIDTLLRNDAVLVDELGFAPLGDTGGQAAVPVGRRRLRTQVARHRLALAVRVLGPVPARATTAVTMLDRLLSLPHRRHSRRLLPHETGQSEGRNPSRWAVAVRQSARRKHRGPRGCAHGRRGGHHRRGRCLRGCVRPRSRGGHVGDRCRACRGELEGERHPAQGTADPSDGLQVRLREGVARSNCTGTHDEQLRGRIVQNAARAGVAPHRGFTHPQFWSAATSPNG